MSVVIGAGIGIFLAPWLGETSVLYVLLIVSIIVSAFLSVFWPAVLTTLACIIVLVWLEMEPAATFRLARPEDDDLTLMLFLLSILGITAAAYYAQRARYAAESWAHRLAADVAARGRAEADEHRLAEQRQLALDAAQMGFWKCDTVTQHATWDERFREIFGLSALEGAVHDVVARFHPDNAASVSAALNAAMQSNESKPISMQYRIRRDDGSTRWIEAHGLAAVEDPHESGARKFVGTVRDITDLKSAEERARMNERRLRTFFSSDMIGAVYWTLDGQVTEAKISANFS